MDLDIIIVLSHESKKGNLSEFAKKRIEKAAELYKKNKTKIILSGGYSLHCKKGGPIEAELMKNYALEVGIEEEDILLEIESRDTQGNAYFTKQIAKKNNYKKILIITSDFHIPKTKFFFDFVYGLNYNLSYESSPTRLSKEERKKLDEREKRSQEIMEGIYSEKKIKIGEDEKISEIIREFYSKFN